MNRIRVQIEYNIPTFYGDFSDALYYTMEEYSQMTEADIEAEKSRRLDNWIQNRLEAESSPPPEIPQEALLAYLEAEKKRIATLEARFNG